MRYFRSARTDHHKGQHLARQKTYTEHQKILQPMAHRNTTND